jgi:uncharacterized protein YaaR (DUF327 family)
VKVEIDVPDRYINIVSHWASVGRTFDQIVKIIEEELQRYIGGIDPKREEQYNYTLDEIQEIRGFLIDLHLLVRQEVWNTTNAR